MKRNCVLRVLHEHSPYLNAPVTSITCKKGDTPIGPQYVWFEDGRRAYSNFWAGDGSGKLVEWREYKDGRCYSSKDKLECAVCDKEIEQSECLWLNCNHRFHYNCVVTWLSENSRCCPTCQRLIVAKGWIKNPRWLCNVLAKDHHCGYGLVRDFLGNTMWIKFWAVHNLPGWYDAPYARCDERFLQNTLRLVAIDRVHHIAQLQCMHMSLYIGNVTTTRDDVLEITLTLPADALPAHAALLCDLDL
jgi:hypothetical protein